MIWCSNIDDILQKINRDMREFSSQSRWTTHDTDISTS